MSIKKEIIKVYDMTCTSCENRVENAVKKLNGILSVKANYNGQFAEIEYDDETCDISEIKAMINSAGYSTKNSKDYKFIGILIIVMAVMYLGLKTSGFDMDEKLANASYAVLFMVGVLTSIHCVGMCGGIMLSQSIGKESNNKFEAVKPALLYNTGRVISYTLLGGIVGALGSVISLSITMKAAMQIIAGIFMIMMGFNMAGYSIFRKFHIKLPGFACRVKNKSGSPFIVGILNGLMPCGPLQTMQLYALGTGSATKGALSMFMFSIGTVPLMLTFGALSGLLSKGYTKKILKFSGVLIIVLGLIMGNRGFALAGINVNPLTAVANNTRSLIPSGEAPNKYVAKATLQDGVQIINMTVDNNGYSPNSFYVQKGIPVKWIIDGQALNSCNNSIVVPAQNLEFKVKKGETIIEFTPEDKDMNFSCWMGMIRGVIKVVDSLDSVDTSVADPSLPPPSTTPSCCARPIDEGYDDQLPPSIYGNDLSLVLTERLIDKATVNNEYQNASFKGIGYEFLPLIVAIESETATKFTFDLSEFDNPEGDYLILDIATGDLVNAFAGDDNFPEIELNIGLTGGYAIVKDNLILGIIEVVDDLETTDLDLIREKYIR